MLDCDPSRALGDQEDTQVCPESSLLVVVPRSGFGGAPIRQMLELLMFNVGAVTANMGCLENDSNWPASLSPAHQPRFV